MSNMEKRERVSVSGHSKRGKLVGKEDVTETARGENLRRRSEVYDKGRNPVKYDTDATSGCTDKDREINDKNDYRSVSKSKSASVENILNVPNKSPSVRKAISTECLRSATKVKPKSSFNTKKSKSAMQPSNRKISTQTPKGLIRKTGSTDTLLTVSPIKNKSSNLDRRKSKSELKVSSSDMKRLTQAEKSRQVTRSSEKIFHSSYSNVNRNQNLQKEEADSKVKGMIKKLSDTQKKTQQTVFTGWINFHLSKLDPPLHVGKLFEDLRGGIKLVKLIEVLTGEKQLLEKGKKRIHQLNNINTVVKYLRLQKIKLVNIHADAIVDGNPTITLALLWALINHFQEVDGAVREEIQNEPIQQNVTQKKGIRKKKDLKQKLMQNCEEIFRSNTLIGHDDFRDFGKSWQNGKLLSFLVSHYRPDLLSHYDAASDEEPAVKISNVLTIAEGVLGVPKFVSVDDFLASTPDEKSIMTYISLLLPSLQQSNHLNLLSSDSTSTDDSLDDGYWKEKNTQLSTNRWFWIPESIHIWLSPTGSILNKHIENICSYMNGHSDVDTQAIILDYVLLQNIMTDQEQLIESLHGASKHAILTSQWKNAKQKILYLGDILQDAGLKCSVDSDLRSLLKWIVECEMFLLSICYKNNFKNQMMSIKSFLRTLPSMLDATKAHAKNSSSQNIKEKLQYVTSALENLETELNSAFSKLLFLHYNERVDHLLQTANRKIESCQFKFSSENEIEFSIQKLEKWFIKKKFLERFDARFSRLERALRSLKKFETVNDMCEYEKVLQELKPAAVACMEKLNNHLKDLKDSVILLTQFKSITDNVTGWLNTAEFKLGKETCSESFLDDLSKNESYLDELERLISELSKILCKPKVVENKWILASLRTRFEFLSNYVKELEEEENDMLFDSHLDRIINSGYTCVDEAKRIYSMKTNALNYDEMDAGWLKIEETYRYLLDVQHHVRLLEGALHSSNTNNIQGYAEKLSMLVSDINEQICTYQPVVKDCKKLLTDWKRIDQIVEPEKVWVLKNKDLMKKYLSDFDSVLEFMLFAGKMEDLHSDLPKHDSKIKDIEDIVNKIVSNDILFFNKEIMYNTVKNLREAFDNLEQDVNNCLVYIKENKETLNLFNNALNVLSEVFSDTNQPSWNPTTTNNLSNLLESVFELSGKILASFLPSLYYDKLQKVVNREINQINVKKDDFVAHTKSVIETLASQLEHNIEYIHGDVASIAESIYKKNCSPHDLMEKLYNLQTSMLFKYGVRICHQLEDAGNALESLGALSPELENKISNLCNAKWPDLETEIAYFEEQIQPDLTKENETYEGLEPIVEWLDMTEDILTSMDRAESYDLFHEAHDCFKEMMVEKAQHSDTVPHLEQCYKELSQNWNISELKADLESTKLRFHNANENIDVLLKNLTSIDECFKYLSHVLETIAWVKEMLVLCDIEVEVETEDEVQIQIDKLETLSIQITNHAPNVTDTIKTGKLLLAKTSTPPKLFEESVMKLIRLWTRLENKITEKRQDYETCKEQMLCFSFELQGMMGKLAESEVEFLNSKSKVLFGEESIEDEIEKHKKLISKLEVDADQIEDMFLLGEDLQEKLSSSGSLNVSSKLESIDELKRSLSDDLNHQLIELNGSLQRWNRFTKAQEEFETWILNVEARLDETSSADIQLDTPLKLQNITNEVVTQHSELETINSICNELTDGRHEKRAMDLKNQVCKLNERWDKLYQRCKLKEKTSQKMLSMWYSYKDKLKATHLWYDEVDNKLHVKKCENNNGLKERIKTFEAMTADCAQKKANLEDLIWKGSQLPLKFKFASRTEIKSELKDIDSKSKSITESVSSLCEEHKSVLSNFFDINLKCDNLNAWFESCQGVLIDFKDHYFEKDLDALSKLEQEVKTCMSDCLSKRDLLMSLQSNALKFEIESKSIFHLPNSFGKKIEGMKIKLTTLEKEFPQMLHQISADIKHWEEFIDRLERMEEYLKDRDTISHLPKAITTEEISKQLKLVEERQVDLDAHYFQFEDVVRTSGNRLGSTYDNTELTRKLTFITDTWYKLTKLASEQYQLLALSKHYTQSSEEIVEYLETIEQKLEGDVPQSVQNKMKEQNKKAKVLLKHLQEKVQSLTSPDTACVPTTSNEEDKIHEKVPFEDKLSQLNEEWNNVMADIQISRAKNEEIAKKWWDFSRSKKRIVRWMKKKEEDAQKNNSDASLEEVMENVNKYKELLERIEVHKQDIETLIQSADDLLEDEDKEEGFLRDVTKRFENLELLVNERHAYYSSLINKWKKFIDRKKKLKDVMKASKVLSSFSHFTSLKDIKDASKDCEAIVEQLNDLQAIITDKDDFEESKEFKTKVLNQIMVVKEAGSALNVVADKMKSVKESHTECQQWMNDIKVLDNENIDNKQRECIQKELNAKMKLLEDCNDVAKEVFTTHGNVISNDILAKPLQQMQNDLKEIGETFEIPIKEIEIIDCSSASMENQSPLTFMDSLKRLLEENQKFGKPLDHKSQEINGMAGSALNSDSNQAEIIPIIQVECYDQPDTMLNEEGTLNDISTQIDGLCYHEEDTVTKTKLKLSKLKEIDEKLRHIQVEKVADLDPNAQVNKLFEKLNDSIETQEAFVACVGSFDEAKEEWMEWFFLAKNELTKCKQTSETVENMSDRLESTQGLLDDMESNDNLISNVYERGEELLQGVQGQFKLDIENVLCTYEQEWAAFCAEVEDTRSLIDGNVSKWIEFNQSYCSLKSILVDMQNILEQDDQDKIDHENIENAIARCQAMCHSVKNKDSRIIQLNVLREELIPFTSPEATLHSSYEYIKTFYKNMLSKLALKDKDLHYVKEEIALLNQKLDSFVMAMRQENDVLDECLCAPQSYDNNVVDDFLHKIKVSSDNMQGLLVNISELEDNLVNLYSYLSEASKYQVISKVNAVKEKCEYIFQNLSNESTKNRELHKALSLFESCEKECEGVLKLVDRIDRVNNEDQLADLLDTLEEKDKELELLSSTFLNADELASINPEVKMNLLAQHKEHKEECRKVINSKKIEVNKRIVTNADITENLQGSRNWLTEFLNMVKSPDIYENCKTLDELCDVYQHLKTEFGEKVTSIDTLLQEADHTEIGICVKQLKDKIHVMLSERIRTVNFQKENLQLIEEDMSLFSVLLKKAAEILHVPVNIPLNSKIDNINFLLQELFLVKEKLEVHSKNLYDFPQELKERTTYQENINNTLMTYSSVVDQLNNHMSTLTVNTEKLQTLERTVNEQIEWIGKAQGVFSIDMMSIADEDEMIGQMKVKESYQKELEQRESIIENIMEQINTLKDFSEENFLSKLANLRQLWEQVRKTSEMQDEHFERAMDEEEKYYEEVEKFVNWMNLTSECLSSDLSSQTDTEEMYKKHHSLIDAIEKKASDFDNLVLVGKTISCNMSSNERKKSFEMQLNQIGEEWMQLVKHAEDKEKVIAEKYGLAPKKLSIVKTAYFNLQDNIDSAVPQMSNKEKDVEVILPVVTTAVMCQKPSFIDICRVKFNEQDAIMKGFASVSLTDQVDILCSQIEDLEALQATADDILNRQCNNNDEDTAADIAELKETIVNKHNTVLERKDALLSTLVKKNKIQEQCKQHRDEIIGIEEYVFEIDNPDTEHIIEILCRNENTLDDLNHAIIKVAQEKSLIEDELPLEDYNELTECITEIETIYYEQKSNLENVKLIVATEKRLQGVEILLKNEEQVDTLEEHVKMIEEKINSLVKLQAELELSLTSLDELDESFYPHLTNSIKDRLLLTLPLLQPRITSLKASLKKFSSDFSFVKECTQSIEKYLIELCTTEEYLHKEFALSDCLQTSKIVLRTSSNALINHRDKLGEIVAHAKQNVDRLPTKEKETLQGCLESGINETHKLEDSIIEKDMKITNLITKLNDILQNVRGINTSVHDMISILQANNNKTKLNVADIQKNFKESCQQLKKAETESNHIINTLPTNDKDNLVTMLKEGANLIEELSSLLEGQVCKSKVNMEGLATFTTTLRDCVYNTTVLSKEISKISTNSISKQDIDVINAATDKLGDLKKVTNALSDMFDKISSQMDNTEFENHSVELTNLLKRHAKLQAELNNFRMQVDNVTAESIQNPEDVFTTVIDKFVEFLTAANKDVLAIPMRNLMLGEQVIEVNKVCASIEEKRKVVFPYLRNLQDITENEVIEFELFWEANENEVIQKQKELCDLYVRYCDILQMIKDLHLQLDKCNEQIQDDDSDGDHNSYLFGEDEISHLQDLIEILKKELPELEASEVIYAYERFENARYTILRKHQKLEQDKNCLSQLAMISDKVCEAENIYIKSLVTGKYIDKASSDFEHVVSQMTECCEQMSDYLTQVFQLESQNTEMTDEVVMKIESTKSLIYTAQDSLVCQLNLFKKALNFVNEIYNLRKEIDVKIETFEDYLLKYSHQTTSKEKKAIFTQTGILFYDIKRKVANMVELEEQLRVFLGKKGEELSSYLSTIEAKSNKINQENMNNYDIFKTTTKMHDDVLRHLQSVSSSLTEIDTQINEDIRHDKVLILKDVVEGVNTSMPACYDCTFLSISLNKEELLNIENKQKQNEECCAQLLVKIHMVIEEMCEKESLDEKYGKIYTGLMKHNVVVNDLYDQVISAPKSLEDAIIENDGFATMLEKHENILKLLCDDFHHFDEDLEPKQKFKISELISTVKQSHAQLKNTIDAKAEVLNNVQDKKFEVEEVINRTNDNVAKLESEMLSILMFQQSTAKRELLSSLSEDIGNCLTQLNSCDISNMEHLPHHDKTQLETLLANSNNRIRDVIDCIEEECKHCELADDQKRRYQRLVKI